VQRIVLALSTGLTGVFGDPDDLDINDISFAGGRFFAFGNRWGDYQALAKSSTDDINWTKEPFLAYHLFTEYGVEIRGVFSGGGRTFVFAGEWINNWAQQEIFVFLKD